MKKTFKTKDLLDLDLPDEAVHEEIIDSTRWSNIYEIVFEHDGSFWQTTYSCGATEQQDEGPWEYEDEVDCLQVEKRQVTVEKWVAV